VPDRTGLALFDLPDAQTFELTAPSAPLPPSCHFGPSLRLLGLPVPQKLFSGQRRCWSPRLALEQMDKAGVRSAVVSMTSPGILVE